VACLVAGGFFNLYPAQRCDKHEHFTTLNFKEMFLPTMDGTYASQQSGKLRCFLNYFDRVTKEGKKFYLFPNKATNSFVRYIVPTGQITFRRQTCKEFPDWSNSVKPIKNLSVDADKLIEDAHVSLLTCLYIHNNISGSVTSWFCE